MSNELKHHGIKGQKWGVRRFQNKDGSLTPAGRARYNPDYKSEEREDGSYVIKKGSKVHRVSTSTTTDRKGYAYISFMDEDVKGYRKEITEWMNSEKPGVKTYDLTMKVTKDLILPSEVEKVKTFIDLVKDEKIDTISIMKLKDEYDDYTSTNKAVGRLHDVVDSLMLQGMHADLAMSYACFSLSLFTDSTYKDAFFDALKKERV